MADAPTTTTTKKKNKQAPQKPAPVKAGPPQSKAAAVVGGVEKVGHVLQEPAAAVGTAIHKAAAGVPDLLAGKQTQRGAAKVGHAVEDVGNTINKVAGDAVQGSIAHPLESAYNWVFKTPAQRPATTTRQPKGVPASIVPHPSPTKGESDLAQHVVSPGAKAAVQSGTPAKATPVTPGAAAQGGGLPTPTLNEGNVDTVLNAGNSTTDEQASINTLLQFAVDPAVANQAMAWFTTESANSTSPAEMQSAMYQQGWFKTMFPGITQQLKAGLTPVSPAQYMSDYQNIQQTLTSFGVEPGVLTPAMYGQLTGAGLSAQQITGRLGLAFNQAGADLENNPGAIALLHQWYGVAPTKSAIAAFYMTGDPASGANVAGNLGNVTAAAVGGAAAKATGFDKLDQNTLLSLANQGVTAAQLASASAAQTNILGATETGVATEGQATATQSELIQAAPGVPGTVVGGENAQTAQRDVNLAVGGRNAPFRGGGGFAGQGSASAETGAGFGVQ